ncbi:ABC transporter permease, partial [Actinomadura sediminis]
MIGLALREIRGRPRRLAGTLTAVFLGVAFLTGTLVLGDTLASGLDSSHSGSHGRTDVIVPNAADASDSPRGSRGESGAATLDRAKAVDDVAHAAPLVQGSGPVLGTFRVVIAAFGGVALLVAAFTVHSAFAITAARRTREWALLRALGAEPRQVLAIAGVEALIVGVTGTAAGLAGGLGFAALLRRVLAEYRIGVALDGLTVAATTPLIAAPAGVLLTLAAALGPALRASRSAPVTALREAAAAPGGPAEARVIIGGVFRTVAAGAGAAGAAAGRTSLAAAGALLFVLALVVLGPVE